MAVGGGQLPVRPGQPGEEGARGRLYGGSSIFLGTHCSISFGGFHKWDSKFMDG